MLGLESSSVIGLRMLKVAAGGPAAQAETERMVSEKIASSLSLGASAFSGGLGLDPARAAAHTVAHYRRKVRANQRRLTKA